MPTDDFVSVDGAHELTPSELLAAVNVRCEYLMKSPAIDPADYDRFLDEIQVFYSFLRLRRVGRTATAIEPESTKVWLPRRLPSQFLREEMLVRPNQYSRVIGNGLFFASLADNGYFQKLVYHGDMLLLSSLEDLMDQVDFELRVVSVYKLNVSAYRFIQTFVPRYREWYLSQDPDSVPRPG